MRSEQNGTVYQGMQIDSGIEMWTVKQWPQFFGHPVHTVLHKIYEYLYLCLPACWQQDDHASDTVKIFRHFRLFAAFLPMFQLFMPCIYTVRGKRCHSIFGSNFAKY